MIRILLFEYRYTTLVDRLSYFIYLYVYLIIFTFSGHKLDFFIVLYLYDPHRHCISS